MTLQKRIEEVIAEAEIKPIEIARRIGVSRATVSLWGSGQFKTIKTENIVALADLLGINFRWLQSGQGEKRSDGNVKEWQKTVPMDVPLISWVRAGQFCETEDPFEPGDAFGWEARPKGGGDNCFALVVEGDSMTSPFPNKHSYPSGVKIIVDPDQEVLPGMRGIFKTADSNQATFKELVSDNGELYLKPLNPQYPTIKVTEGMTICGKVISTVRDE